MQYNKRDLPDIMTPEEMNADLDRYGAEIVHASALNGEGVFETLKALSKKVLVRVKRQQEAAAAGAS
jgi:signal recognition particle receptor subunit beta